MLGDAYGAGIVYHFVKGELDKIDQENAMGACSLKRLDEEFTSTAEANGPDHEPTTHIHIHSEAKPSIRPGRGKGDENETLM